MPQRRVSALVTSLEPYKVPDEILYVPEGKHHIFPQSHPEGIEISMPPEKGALVAAAFQRQLNELRANSVHPRLDFDHKTQGPASGYPQTFRYQPGKGIMCGVKWSRSGKEALEGGDYGYFSPTVDIDDDGVPAALPDRGPLGALVNDPAFREMPRVAAAAAEKSPKQPAMPNELVTCGLLTETEAARENAAELARTRVSAMKSDGTTLSERDKRVAELEEENKKLKAAAAESAEKDKKAKEEEANTLIEAALADGRLDPQDEEATKDFRARLVAGDAFAKKMLAALPTKNEGIDKPIVKASAAAGGKKEETPEKGPLDRLAASIADAK